jgi:hypothetical protein
MSPVGGVSDADNAHHHVVCRRAVIAVETAPTDSLGKALQYMYVRIYVLFAL